MLLVLNSPESGRSTGSSPEPSQYVEHGADTAMWVSAQQRLEMVYFEYAFPFSSRYKQ